MSDPGWYDDPDYANTQRWWDGSQWTENRNPPLPRNRPQPPAWQRYLFVVIALAIVGLVVFGLISANEGI